MSRSELPQGVSPTNDSSANDLSANEKPSFAAPRAGHRLTPIEAQHDFVEHLVEENSAHGEVSGADRALKIQPSPLIIMIVLVGLVTALAAIIIANTRSPLPLCADQPEWNQYNCKRG